MSLGLCCRPAKLLRLHFKDRVVAGNFMRYVSLTKRGYAMRIEYLIGAREEDDA